MVYCIQAQLGFRNAARRNTVSSNIQAYIASKTTWGPVFRQDYVTPIGDPTVSLEVRFTTQAEQNQAWIDIQAFLGSGVNGPVVGSTIYRHGCTHDEARPVSCVVVEKVSF